MRRQPAPCERRRLAGALLLLLRGASAYVIISSCGEGARCRDAKIQWARVPKTGSSTILSAVLAIEGPSRPPLVACGADRLDAMAARHQVGCVAPCPPRGPLALAPTATGEDAARAAALLAADLRFAVVREPVDRFASAWAYLQTAHPEVWGAESADAFVAALAANATAAGGVTAAQLVALRGPHTIALWPQSYWVDAVLARGAGTAALVCYDRDRLVDDIVALFAEQFGCARTAAAGQRSPPRENVRAREVTLAPATAARLRALYARDRAVWARHCAVPPLDRILAGGNYSQQLYRGPGRVPRTTAPPGPGQLRFLWFGLLSPAQRAAVRALGICADASDAPTRALFAPLSRTNEPPGAVWRHADNATAMHVPSHGYVEVTHCARTRGARTRGGAMWFYAAAGSGVSVNVGRTKALPFVDGRQGLGTDDEIRDMLRVEELDSVQFWHRDRSAPDEPRYEIAFNTAGGSLAAGWSEWDALNASFPLIKCGREPYLFDCPHEGHPPLRYLADCGAGREELAVATQACPTPTTASNATASDAALARLAALRAAGSLTAAEFARAAAKIHGNNRRPRRRLANTRS